ncbi:MAG: polysaccharide biosynthesis protein [Planctomycetota bacterium]|jgi:FlaA1/EpsC-like NDP-sugar epimerase
MGEAKNNGSGGRIAGTLARLEPIAARHRFLVNVILHSFIFALALLLAYAVRFDIELLDASKRKLVVGLYVAWLPIFVLLKLLIFGGMKLFRGGWQYTSIRDVTQILVSSWIFLAIMFGLWLIFNYFPRLTDRRVPVVGKYFSGLAGVLVLDFLATVFLVCTARLGFRIYREELRPISHEGVKRVLIVGAGNAAETIVREIHRMRVERYRVIGFVDDDPHKKGLMIHGLPVLGKTEDLRRICEDENVEEIIIAMPSATQKELRRVIDLCSGTKLKFQSLPGVGDLIDGRVTVSQIRPVDIDDLLGRETVELDNEAIGRFIRDRRVLVTGAGGSIGSEMCRRICTYGPARLVLVEQAETPLFDIENELTAAHPELSIEAVICDIYDRQRVMDVWEQFRPEVVVHAAAHKHVPLMERNPCEAIKNNVIGTQHVADASCKYETKEFVTISTDKAVNPSSIMGASKRVAEIYTQALDGQANCKTQFKAVRFGNVLGSAGSVVPTFRKQIAGGGPITVTHPDMRRYFMTIREASQLVLQAAATGIGGQIFLLDMGEPVRIVDLARNMITLSGFRPGEDIDIAFTGVRPGEKLFEELRTDGEDMEPTVHPKVSVWKSRKVDWEAAKRAVEELAELQNCTDRKKIVEALRRIVPEYESLKPDDEEKPAGSDPNQEARQSRSPGALDC